MAGKRAPGWMSNVSGGASVVGCEFLNLLNVADWLLSGKNIGC